jgi:protein SCO1
VKFPALALLLVAASPLPARALEPLPAGVDVVEKLGERVPSDVALTDENGKRVQLGDYLHDGKPILLTMVYYRCPMLCSLVLNGVVSALRQQSWQPGKEFHVLTVSFDPEDKPDTAKKKQAGYMSALGLAADRASGWPFLTGTQEEVAKLADAVGFRYRWDAVNKTWDHTAVVVALAPDGKITRYLYGVQYPPRDVQLALFEAAGGRVGTTMERALLRCYAYDTGTKSYRVAAVRVMRGGALLVFGVLVTFLTIMWRRDIRKTRAEARV